MNFATTEFEKDDPSKENQLSHITDENIVVQQSFSSLTLVEEFQYQPNRGLHTAHRPND